MLENQKIISEYNKILDEFRTKLEEIDEKYSSFGVVEVENEDFHTPFGYGKSIRTIRLRNVVIRE